MPVDPGAQEGRTQGGESSGEPLKLVSRGDAPAPLVFHRGARAPYAVRWFGVTSLAGHVRNFVASAIAAESIDSRDWMRPSSAEDLLSTFVGVLGGDSSRRTLAEALGRPVWIDFVADTGDDRDVSKAVARMLFATFSVSDGENEPRVLPRGDVLLFGGDTAYPVATGEEIARRLLAPWNEVLRERQRADERPRVLIGIAGNHDWYDGLDGFGRLFRRSPEGAGAVDESDTFIASVGAPPHRPRRTRQRAGVFARQLHLDEVGGAAAMFAAIWGSIRALWSGTKIGRPRRLALIGYEPVQDASYWAIRLAPGLELWGVDRQLGRLDFRQRMYFAERRRSAPNGRILFVAPDPAIAFGEPNAPGDRMLSACGLSLERDSVFYLTGDVHHYERRHVGAGSLHVIAGGGGAFLHGTRISPAPGGPSACAFPSRQVSRRLLAQVPLKLMVGSAGFVLHIAFGLMASFEIGASSRGTGARVVAAFAIAAALVAALYANVGHNRPRRRRVAAVAVPFGAALGVLPMALRATLPRIVPTLAGDVGVIVVSAFAGPLGIGLFLGTIAVLGLDHQQAFSVLSHPGFKHFVRMCLQPNGRIDGWVIGKDDPLQTANPALIDRFTWQPSQPE
ncbi:MAG: hypothetical protein M3O50_13830 [Myxococcota bacterium]|nr:hypothetical protein [Myxococcota bacterium]